MTLNRKIHARHGMLLAAVVWGAVSMAGPVQAGFEWKPPPPRSAPQAPMMADSALPAMPASPALPVESAPLMTPEMPEMSDNFLAPSFSPGEPAAPLYDERAVQAAMNETAPAEDWPATSEMVRPRGPEGRVIRAVRPQAPVVTPITQEALTAPALKMPERGSFAVTEGFGRDIPLALALQQIVPPDYSFGFGADVNPGVRISWEGGKAWNEVLQEALNPHDLAADVTGKAVMIRSGRPLMATAPLAQPPAQIYKAASAPAQLQPAPVADMFRLVEDWRNEDNYQPSYPRRDPEAARTRMMQDAARIVHEKEPSSYDPDVMRQNTAIGDDLTVPPPVSFVSDAAPMPLMTAPPATGKSYMQLTGLDDSVMRRLDPHEIRYWQAEQGASLREVMKNWAETAGVQLFWATGPDYSLPAPIQMHGTFPNAIAHILEIFDNMHPQPQGQLHTNQPGGPAVLIIDHAA